MLRLISFISLFIASQVFAIDINPSPQVTAQFSAAHAQGTFVLFDVSAQRFSGHNAARAQTRYSPASTFKIPSSLIGLATGAVSSVDEVFYHYDGPPQYLKSWEHDMGLRGAIKVSNVSAYQQLARKVGQPAMQQQLDALHYGNRKMGAEVDQFWLDGALTISAVEQTQFLARLAQGALPYSMQHQAAVRDIARLDQGKDWVLYGKTGWTGKKQPSTGWFVGWLEQRGKIYSFALNMDIPDVADLPKRIDIAKASLRAQGLM